MPKKKSKILSLEVSEINAQWDYSSSKPFRNFICKEEDVEETLERMLTKSATKHEKTYTDQVEAILAPRGSRKSSNVFFGEEVSVEEAKLPKSIKPTSSFVYKLYDYTDNKLKTEYGTQKDAVSYISKRIKTKYAVVTHNGRAQKIENTQKAMIDILSHLEDTTSQLGIEPIGRTTGDTEDIIIVSIFKNCVK